MDELFQKSIQRIEASKKSSVPWKAGEPYPQSYYSYDGTKQEWMPKTPTSNNIPLQEETPSVLRLALYSWNIDFMLPLAEARMDAALAHLESLINTLPSTTAVVIFLQECVESDLAAIGGKSWVRDRFHVTDVDLSNWTSGYYGTTTLVDRRLRVASCFRVHYEETRMERDAFFVDVLMGGGPGRPVRLCNTHLESLALEPPFRPLQMRLVGRYLHEDGVRGGIAAGDFNAIQPLDRTLHEDNGLKDAYLELGGREDADEGYTWGQQAATILRERFGCSRMDKVYFCGQLRLLDFGRFGADVEASDNGGEIVALGIEKPWVSDHLGVTATFEAFKPDPAIATKTP